MLDGPEALGVTTLKGVLDGRDRQLAPTNRTNHEVVPVSIIVLPSLNWGCLPPNLKATATEIGVMKSSNEGSVLHLVPPFLPWDAPHDNLVTLC
jgi:hypothetical protein